MFGAQFVGAMNDDLNISAALSVMFDFIRSINKKIVDNLLQPSEARAILDEWHEIDKVLGFGLPSKSEVPADVQALFAKRQAARQSKDFKRADEIRAQLTSLGWTLEDTPQGPRAKRL